MPSSCTKGEGAAGIVSGRSVLGRNTHPYTEAENLETYSFKNLSPCTCPTRISSFVPKARLKPS